MVLSAGVRAMKQLLSGADATTVTYEQLHLRSSIMPGFRGRDIGHKGLMRYALCAYVSASTSVIRPILAHWVT